MTHKVWHLRPVLQVPPAVVHASRVRAQAPHAPPPAGRLLPADPWPCSWQEHALSCRTTDQPAVGVVGRACRFSCLSFLVPVVLHVVAARPETTPRRAAAQKFSKITSRPRRQVYSTPEQRARSAACPRNALNGRNAGRVARVQPPPKTGAARGAARGTGAWVARLAREHAPTFSSAGRCCRL